MNTYHLLSLSFIILLKTKCDIMNDDNILNEVHSTFNHSKATRRLYKQAVKKYTNFFGMSLDELIEEAEKEEDSGVRWKRRTIKRRIINYRQYLLENHCINTVLTLMRPILVIYKYFEIEIHELSKLNRKQAIKPEPIRFKDLPDKEIIREAVNISDPKMKAIILFMCSSGCARRETLNLTIQDYIDALKEYTNKKDIYAILEDLEGDRDIIPTFNVRRQKTDKYYTFQLMDHKQQQYLQEFLLARSHKQQSYCWMSMIRLQPSQALYQQVMKC